MQDGEINFFSVSADGKVYNWVLMQNELAVTTVIALTLPLEPIAGPDGAVVSVKGLLVEKFNSCCCISDGGQWPLY